MDGSPVVTDGTGQPGGTGIYAALSREIEMLADRYRTLPEARLRRPPRTPLPAGQNRAEAGLRLAQQLADAALGVTARAEPEPPAWRTVPRAGPFAVGDQIAVTGHDLLAALAGVPDTAQVWTREGRGTVAEVVAALREVLVQLRLVV